MLLSGHRQARGVATVVGILLATIAVSAATVDSQIRTAKLMREPMGPPLTGDGRWPLDLLRLPAAWDITTGEAPGPLVAVVDSGVVITSDLTGRVTGQSFAGGRPNDDTLGHGTQVAGIIAASGSDGSGLVGVCWTCRILSLRITDSASVVSDRVAQAIDAAVAHKASVINLSLGSRIHTQAERDAVARAVAAGIVVVAAAGSDGSSTPVFPAAYPGVLAVGSVGANRKLAPASNRGSWVSVLAPECGAALGPHNIADQGFCGTSASAAFASGVAALLRAAVPKADGRDIIAAIQRTARPVAGSEYGIIDAVAALRAIQKAKPLAGSETKGPLLHIVRRPMMSGVGAVGGRLEASTGAWSGPVSSVAIRWERCTRSGLRCRVVARRLPIYHVVAADAGHSIRVVVRVVGEDDRAVEAASHLLPIRR